MSYSEPGISPSQTLLSKGTGYMDEKRMERVNPELRKILEVALIMPRLDLSDIPSLRDNPVQMPVMPLPQIPGIEDIAVEDRTVPGPEGAPGVAVKIYTPPVKTGGLPALLWIHGGGYILGDAEQDEPLTRRLCLQGGCVVVSVDYRLAPENPFPAAIEDCYAALTWLASHVGELGIDGGKIGIGGASAGGGLAAGLALLARDRAEVDIRFQMLIYPMIDDCNVVPAGEGYPDTFLWTRESNLIGWRSYLGREPGEEGVSAYASACRASDLRGLPPTYIAVGELDLFMKESVEYARRLVEAGVALELHVYPGAFHAFDMMAPDAGVSRRFTEDYVSALKRAF